MSVKRQMRLMQRRAILLEKIALLEKEIAYLQRQPRPALPVRALFVLGKEWEIP